ncbi:MAG: FGGY family carbohydrate kinase [Actinopolymorphaceae bacterium]
MSSQAIEHQAVLAIDQGTTNSKAILVGTDGSVLAVASAPVGLSLPRPGWTEQDAEQIWTSVLTAVRDCLGAVDRTEVIGVALATQRESVVGWHRATGRPVGPLIGWQDVRTAAWCESLPASVDGLARSRTGLGVDAMFSAPKIHWMLDSISYTAASDVCVGTVDSWLIWLLTGRGAHVSEAGNASRTLLYDVVDLDWSEALLETFCVPRRVLPDVVASNGEFGTTSGVPGLRDGIPVLAVMADSHAAMYGQGCTEIGMVKATYGTGSSVMTPAGAFTPSDSGVPSTLAWLTDRPFYAREGNILSSGSTLAWTAETLGLGRVADLVELAVTVPDAGGVILVPAFAGLGAPHWDRNARAAFTGMHNATTRAHMARAAVDAVAHQISDITETIDPAGTALTLLRADGGATVADLLMQTQADLLGHRVEVANVAEVSALGAAQLAWERLGASTGWAERRLPGGVFEPGLDPETRTRLRTQWAAAVDTTRAASRSSARPF